MTVDAQAVPPLHPRRALALGLAGFLCEVAQLTPWVDDLAARNSTAHFTQHGLVFAGGVLMGWALRELRLIARGHTAG